MQPTYNRQLCLLNGLIRCLFYAGENKSEVWKTGHWQWSAEQGVSVYILKASKNYNVYRTLRNGWAPHSVTTQTEGCLQNINELKLPPALNPLLNLYCRQMDHETSLQESTALSSWHPNAGWSFVQHHLLITRNNLLVKLHPLDIMPLKIQRPGSIDPQGVLKPKSFLRVSFGRNIPIGGFGAIAPLH